MTASSTRLAIVVASTRPERVGPHIAAWVEQRAVEHDQFDVRVIDLAELALPLLDEPSHPSLRQYTKDHTWRWSRLVEASDAFIFVVPEYNSGYSAALKNALDYLFSEWHHKPAAFVSYGGISGGLRGVQQAKQVLAALKMTPVLDAVTIPFVSAHLRDGEFEASAQMESSLKGVFDELRRYSQALAPLRQPAG